MRQRGKSTSGRAECVGRRYLQHFRQLERGRHHCERLQAAYDSRGIEGLAFRVIEVCSAENLWDRERHHVRARKPAMNSMRLGCGVPFHADSVERAAAIMQRGTLAAAAAKLDKLLSAPRSGPLTQKQLAALAMYNSGMSVTEIGKTLGVKTAAAQSVNFPSHGQTV
jgi:hypothetical protein